MAITAFTTEWDGHQGSEVEEFIKTYLQSHETSVSSLNNTAVVKLTAGYKNTGEVDDDGNPIYDETTIEIKGYNKGGLVVTTDEFATITKASYTLHLTTYNYNRILDKNTAFSVPYDYYVDNDEGIKEKGYHADVTFTIINKYTRTVHIATTYESKTSSTLVRSNLLIPAEKLGIGTNTITMNAVTKVGTSLTRAYSETFTIYVASLNLSASLVNDSFYIPKAYDLLFVLKTDVMDDNNDTVQFSYKDGEDTINLLVFKRIYINRIGTSYMALNQLTANLLTTSFNQLVHSATSYGSAEVDKWSTVRILIQAYIPLQDGSEIVSNTVLMDMLNITGINNSGNDAVQVATMLNDVNMSSTSVKTYSTQYAKVPYTFYLYSPVDSTYDIQVNNESKTDLVSLSANLLTTVRYAPIFKQIGDFEVKIGNFAVTNIVKPLDTSIKEPADETLNLQASDKSIGSIDNTWGNVTTFEGFNWKGNGWVSTTDGTALLINNGASITIDYRLCDKTKYPATNTTFPFTISFRYKILNGTNESEELIKCMASNTGILIKPQYVELGTSSKISLNVSNDDVHEVTFVYYGTDESSGLYKGLQAIYIDGKYQAITKAGVFVTHSDKITVLATEASIYLYSIKAYRKALSFTLIQALYGFNQNDSDFIPQYINENNIFNVDTTSIGDYGLNIKSTNIPDGSFVVVLGSLEKDPTPWKTINSYIKDAAEVNKGRIHALKYIKGYVKGTAAHPRNFYMDGGSMSAQGTSSMDYSLKNLRTYTNKNAKKSGITEYDDTVGKTSAMYQGTAENPLPYTFNPETATDLEKAEFAISKNANGTYGYLLYSTEYGDSYTSAPANRFCWKADYAESSGVHNTGFARLSNYGLKASKELIALDITSSKESSMLPLQIAVSGDNEPGKYNSPVAKNPTWNYDVRANIDGRPVYLFYYDTTTNTEYYAGRYNMNNDKSNVQVFGFEQVTDYFENPIVKAEGQWLRLKAATTLDTKGKPIDPNYALTHGAAEDDEFINPTECWEFSSNDGLAREMGSFYYDAESAFDVRSTDNDPEDANYKALYWLNGTWEYRYPDLDGGSDADLAYRHGDSKPYLLYLTYLFLYRYNYGRVSSLSTLNEFVDNLHLYFNVNSIVKYFILTHWFAAVDQRVKNCMLSFYCDPYGVSLEEAEQSPLHYMRGYYIFYDNDTTMGLNNAGAIDIPWNFYETDQDMGYSSFPGNGIHGIWTNLLRCYEIYRDGLNTQSSAYALGALIAQAYRELRNTLTDEVIDIYLNKNQCDYYPAAVHNADLEVKYLNPNNLRTEEGKLEIPIHLDMAHGTREFHRKLWLKKRTLWMDDLYCSSEADNYRLTYKTSGQPGTDKGTIKLTVDPAFRFWRFYGWSGLKSINKSTSILTSADIGLISITGEGTLQLSISDTFNVSDLYGCKTIDFTSWEFDPINGFELVSLEGVFPYLSSFILRQNTNSVVKCTTDGGFTNWISYNAMPKLKLLYACNIQTKDGSSFPSLDLSGFTLMELIDLRGTSISDVTLPLSPTLRSLSLTNPVSLEITNKPNITSINIDTSELNTLIVQDVSKTVYKWALESAILAYGNNLKEFTIEFGNSIDNPFIGDLEILNLIDQLALKVNKKTGTTIINVSGYIYCSQDFDLDAIEQAFDGLSISHSISTEGFKFEWSGDLYEDYINYTGENNEEVLNNCLMVKGLNAKVTSWQIAVDGDFSNNLDGRIQIVQSSSSRCYIHANPYDLNAKVGGVDHILTVYATLADGSVYNTYDSLETNINIYYNPITLLNITTNSKYISAEDALLTFDFGNHTKKHLLTLEYESNFITAGVNTTITLSYIDNILVGANVALNGTSDTKVDVNIWGAQNSIMLFYNEVLATMQLLDQNSSEYWIKVLCDKAQSSIVIGAEVDKQLASEIPVGDFWDSMIGDLYDVTNPLDFTKLLYFNLGVKTDGVFRMPAIPLTNLVVPMNTKSFMWTSVSDNIGSYATVKLTKEVKKAVIQLTFNSVPENLIIDLSDTDITNIGEYGNTLTNVNNYYVSTNITVTTLPSSMRSTPLFRYPTTLVQLGNTNKNIDSITSSLPAALMFNLNNDMGGLLSLLNATAQPPIFSLSGLSSDITLGNIISYRSKGSVFNTTDFTKITNVELAFVFNNNALIDSEIFKLLSVKNIGNYALYRTNSFTDKEELHISTVQLNGNTLTSIGDFAFARGDYNIVNSNSPTADIPVFNKVTSLGTNAFANFNAEALNIQFGNALTTVGANCFTSANKKPVNVYINKTSALTNVLTTSFGTRTTSNVTIYVPAESDLYKLLTAPSMECASRVQTYNFTQS